MGAEIGSGPFPVLKRSDVGAGVAHALVALPAGRFVAVAVVAQELRELGLVGVERQGAGMAHGLRELRAKRQAGRLQRLGALGRANRRRDSGAAGQSNKDQGTAEAKQA